MSEEIAPAGANGGLVAIDGSDQELLQGLETEEERRVAIRIMPALLDRATQVAEARKAKALRETIEELTAESRKVLEAEVKKLQEAHTPPTPQELETLLSQEYVEFRVQLPYGDGTKDFAIRELPQSVEMKFFKVLQSKLVPRLQELSAFKWTATDDVATNVKKILEIIPGGLEIVAELCVLALDPRGQNPEITAAWVQDNLSTFRIMNIVGAQLTAARIRDFFSLVSRIVPARTII